MGGAVDFANLARGAFRPFLDFVFPPTCLGCGNLLSGTEHHVCTPCWDSIPRLHGAHPLYCQTRDRLVDTEVIADLVSVFLFEQAGVVQALAHALKYSGFRSVGRTMGYELGSALVRSGIGADLLIPVPLYRSKLRERGFNQAEEIALGAADVTGIQVRNDVLSRIRATRTQTKLDHTQREKNVAGAFSVSVSPSGIANLRCVLIDDVITTGATIGACAQELTDFGARSVIAASVALAE